MPYLVRVLGPENFGLLACRLKKFDFTGYFGDDSYSTKCKVNTDIYEYCGMKKIICISEFEDNIINAKTKIKKLGPIVEKNSTFLSL